MRDGQFLVLVFQCESFHQYMTSIGCFLGKIQGYKTLNSITYFLKTSSKTFCNYPKSLKNFLLAQITGKQKAEKILPKLRGRMSQIDRRLTSCEVQIRQKISIESLRLSEFRTHDLVTICFTVVCIKVRRPSFPRFWKNHP